ncbi:Thiol-disulfide isomerase or thioredoxin [Nocardioides terrae]|uniref:Thiol-disulfide isomerase or thioredoxin n=1 Tax=Nocardioides terrae TaxID=574651 RepID=A0A1I1HCU1_9ACTN|nr:TlpA disulfide reductase family protein [Nocardioides terrae]SFC21616.1 Thiol-disulfide isomerase or thioredoxin [Nocardioides terrae]
MRRLLPLLLLALVATGCSDLSGTNKGGYITGDGTTTVWAPDDRGAPIELTGTTLDGKDVDLADLRGKPAVVNVWWSGCGPCRAEMPMLQEASTELAGEAAFLGINTRDGSAANGLAFERSVGASYPSIYAPDGRALLAFPGLPRPLPSTVVLDAQGRISAMISGPIPSRLTLTELVQCAASASAEHCEADT